MRNDDWYDDDKNNEEFEVLLQTRTEELYKIPNAIPLEDGTIILPVLPLRDMIIYPQMVSPLLVGRDLSILAIDAAQGNQQTLIGLTQIEPDVNLPGAGDMFSVGVELAVGSLLNLPDGANSVLAQGRNRVEIIEFIQLKPYLVARARILPEKLATGKETEALMRSIQRLFEKVMRMNRSIPQEAYEFALNIHDPAWLSDMVSASLDLPLEQRLGLLKETDASKRLKTVNRALAEELDVLHLEGEIQDRVQSQVDRGQREIYLREQLKAIQSELGEVDIWSQEISEINQRIEAAGLPEEVKARAIKESGRLNQLPPMSPEVGIIRTYLEWILDLPWVTSTEDNLSIKQVAEELETNHYALQKVKERILEYIAVRSLRPDNQRQPILCFVGPPGTGKTSIGKSIAKALGRKFVRISLGGVRDEAEIRGHRRTYIGALPGRILQTMRNAGTTNPLFMLDEIDKLSTDYRGDPASALLEVLDPEQNNGFSDHYLELPFDLSKVMFITTANWAGRIPEPLMDRMEVIDFSGYIEEEKVEIARRFLIDRQITENGLDDHEIQFSEQAIQLIIRQYTFEAGVRNLERTIGRVCRKIARNKAEERPFITRIQASSIGKLLGPAQFFNTEAEREDEIGIATALAWTDNGGEIMIIEVLTIDGKGNMQITGQVGDVMQESAQAAHSFIKSRAEVLEINPEDFESTDIHIHIPEGSIPKDGPSAGVTLGIALASVYTERKVRRDVGMTGEITLRGRILPVGGVKEKILAAHRAGLRTVLIPEKNLKDLVDLPRKTKHDMEIIPVTHFDEILEIALLPNQPPAVSPQAQITRQLPHNPTQAYP